MEKEAVVAKRNNHVGALGEFWPLGAGYGGKSETCAGASVVGLSLPRPEEEAPIVRGGFNTLMSDSDEYSTKAFCNKSAIGIEEID